MDAHLSKPLDRTALLQLLRDMPSRSALPSARADQPETPILDPAALDVLERELGHAAHGILAEFVGELRRALALLANASPAERGDAAHVQHAAHRLVGAARTLGAARLALEADILQKAARGGDASAELQANVIAIARTTLPEIERRLGVVDMSIGPTLQRIEAA
jgi:HPt (histidine-containing phosphotransfer) domain-containing protein